MPFAQDESELPSPSSGSPSPGVTVTGSHPGDRYVRYVPANDLPLKPVGARYYVADVTAPKEGFGRLLYRLERVLIGRQLSWAEAKHERLNKVRALAILSSDAISSTAYATEEALRILVLAGLVGYSAMLSVGIAIVLLIAIVAFSYSQTIMAYPEGGGTYHVTLENLGKYPGLVAASALLIDYTMTVAVSISSGVAAVTSAFPSLYPYRVEIAVASIAFITLVNLRGVRESGTVFVLPTYAFIVSMYVLLGLGFAAWLGILPLHPHPVRYPMPEAVQPLTLFLILRAFASGSSALTGVEAIANGIPIFKEPQTHNARITLVWMAGILATIFFGIHILTYHFHLVPSDEETIVSQLARTIVGESPFYYFIQAATAGILFLAAETAFADFPRLSYLLARDRFLPHHFRFQGDRLAFNTGILVLGVLTSLLVIIKQASVTALIPLYAVGAFSAFTFSQTGMVVHWWRMPDRHRHIHSMVINGIGAVATGIATIVIIITKFIYGAWMVIVIVPVLVSMMAAINHHYRSVAEQLRLSPIELRQRAKRPIRRSTAAVVPIASLNRASYWALEYARMIARDVTAVHVAVEPESGEILRKRWEEAGLDIPLVIVESPYRELIGPLVAVIEKIHREKGCPFLTVVIPEFVPAHWWERILHTQTAWRLRRVLSHVPDIAITGVPYHLVR